MASRPSYSELYPAPRKTVEATEGLLDDATYLVVAGMAWALDAADHLRARVSTAAANRLSTSEMPGINAEGFVAGGIMDKAGTITANGVAKSVEVLGRFHRLVTNRPEAISKVVSHAVEHVTSPRWLDDI